MSFYKKNSTTNTKNPKKNEFVENEMINRKKNLNDKLLNFLYINIWLIYKLYLKVINK